MRILAVDTATFSCGVALLEGDQVVFKSVHVSRETHSRRLMPMIDNALQTTGLTVHHIDGFAVTKGPGSFTGLRIGISTVQGLAAAMQKPVVGISALDALAWPFYSSAMPVCVLMDARKGEVYTCRYRPDGKTLKKTDTEEAMPPDAALKDIHEPSVLVGSGAVAYKEVIKKQVGANAVFAPPFQNMIDPAIIGHQGLAQLIIGQIDAPDTIAPTYLRQPDAVINRQKAAVSSKQ
ncbi:MAG: tRNA (adenosine(37)-N6)-threonylcarbamoyltransferase complex dimerization subunit type 1 TsaB [Thermodesulfobacteriota bacterium]|nr:tRNA (adenosine(37)-N6)-threonylcarbamoyltransferase complex dimerization subunit type 1 TsaB [Thermodesulfobacteriota bacterium]